MENDSSLLEILTQYEVVISYRKRLLEMDPTVTRVDLYRGWINGEISTLMLKIQRLCWEVIAVTDPPIGGGSSVDEETECEMEKVVRDDDRGGVD